MNQCVYFCKLLCIISLIQNTTHCIRNSFWICQEYGIDISNSVLLLSSLRPFKRVRILISFSWASSLIYKFIVVNVICNLSVLYNFHLGYPQNTETVQLEILGGGNVIPGNAFLTIGSAIKIINAQSPVIMKWITQMNPKDAIYIQVIKRY